VIDALLEPTVIYVKGTVELLRSEIEVKGLAHITGGGVLNLLRLGFGSTASRSTSRSTSHRSSA